MLGAEAGGGEQEERRPVVQLQNTILLARCQPELTCKFLACALIDSEQIVRDTQPSQPLRRCFLTSVHIRAVHLWQQSSVLTTSSHRFSVFNQSCCGLGFQRWVARCRPACCAGSHAHRRRH